MNNIGLFGKMPSMGDFVSRSLSAQLCKSMDHVLQAALMAATTDSLDRRELMARSAPVMLTIRPGAFSETGFSGLWFPSCDRVGRVFPMCVGMETGSGASRLPLTWPSASLTRALCQAVSSALQQNDGPDELLARLPSLEQWMSYCSYDTPFSGMEEETVPTFSVDGSHFYFKGPESQMTVSERALGSRLPWVAEILGTIVRPDGSVDTFFSSGSLFTWVKFAALFDAKWDHWGWTRHTSHSAIFQT
jgi:type VI secretion system ImpM family protein